MGLIHNRLVTSVYNWALYPIYTLVSTIFNISLSLILGSNLSIENEHKFKQQNLDKSDDESLFPSTVNFIPDLSSFNIKDIRNVSNSNININTDANANTNINTSTALSLTPISSISSEKEHLTVKQCSTALDSIFVPIKNQNGELEFKLGNEENLIPYTTSIISDNNDGSNNNIITQKNGFISLSPVSSIKSNSSNNSLSLSNQTNNISTSSNSNSNLNSNLNSDSDNNLEDDIPDSEKIHQCPHCNSKFRMRGYLTRHIKKHSKTKAYHCPFYNDSLDSNSKCHQTGGFSRRDTFKTHLKCRHFKYPPGVKSNNRTGMMGWCGICGEKFLNNEIWVERHIELGLCPGLPDDYIKSLKIGKKKTGKHSKFLDVSNLNDNSKKDNQLNQNKIESAIQFDNKTNDNGSYLQSPSSVNSSPLPHLVNQQSPSIQSPANLLNKKLSNDIETLALLIKQQELTRIIETLKQKQQQAEELEKLKNIQQIEQIKQLQQAQQLKQLQQIQQLQLQIQNNQEMFNLVNLSNTSTTTNNNNNNNNNITPISNNSSSISTPDLNERQLQQFLMQQMQQMQKLQQNQQNITVKNEFDDEDFTNKENNYNYNYNHNYNYNYNDNNNNNNNSNDILKSFSHQQYPDVAVVKSENDNNNDNEFDDYPSLE